MNIGKLDSKIRIYKLSVGQNELCEDSPVRELLRAVWAHVEPRTGSLISGRPGESMLSRTTHAITVRAESLIGVDAQNVILWNDRNGLEHEFKIDYILPSDRTHPLSTVYVEEVV